MTVECWVDTNVILRFITQEPEEHAAIATDLMEEVDSGKVTLHVHSLVVAECCYVLSGKMYKLNHDQIAELLKNFLLSDGIKTKDEFVLLQALDLFGLYGIDFEDALLAVHANHNSPKNVVTFNKKDFNKTSVEHYLPQEILRSLNE